MTAFRTAAGQVPFNVLAGIGCTGLSREEALESILGSMICRNNHILSINDARRSCAAASWAGLDA